jgi:type II secretory pathway component GspD/PulD (secretin)
VRTFFLANVTETNEANDILTDLRNVLPGGVHVYFVATQGAISIWGTADEITLAQGVISELDRKRKVYRLTYSITEMDAGKPTAVRHLELTVPANAKSVVKQGNRAPLVTGSANPESEKPSSQVQYIDLGLNIEAQLEGSGEVLRLRTSVEESSIADEKSGLGAQDPVIRQTKLDGVAMLTQGKPVALGSLDIPGTTRREVIEVVSELVR